MTSVAQGTQSRSWHAFIVVTDAGAPMRYLTMNAGLFEFTDNALEALQFVRKSDAERMLEPGWAVHSFTFRVEPAGVVVPTNEGRL